MKLKDWYKRNDLCWFQYVFERDTRDHPILPNHGSCAKLRTELAGLGGDAKFVKCDLKMSYYHNIFKDLVSTVVCVDLVLFATPKMPIAYIDFIH